jgi:hypothetical protein
MPFAQAARRKAAALRGKPSICLPSGKATELSGRKRLVLSFQRIIKQN